MLTLRFWPLFLLLCFSCSFEAPEKNNLIVVLDTSSSFAKQHGKVAQTVRHIIHRLAPHDRFVFYKLDQEGLTLIRDSISPSIGEFDALFKHHAQISGSKRKGTSYRLAMDALLATKTTKPRFMVFFGDFADEKTTAGQRLTPDYLQTFAKKLGTQTPFFALGVSPDFQLKLMPLKNTLKDNFFMLSPDEMLLGEQLLLEKMKR